MSKTVARITVLAVFAAASAGILFYNRDYVVKPAIADFVQNTPSLPTRQGEMTTQRISFPFLGIETLPVAANIALETGTTTQTHRQICTSYTRITTEPGGGHIIRGPSFNRCTPIG